MGNTLLSKTNLGLYVLLIVVVGLALVGKLTAESVEAIKYIGGSFMLVRGIANHSENKYGTDSK